MRVHGKLRTKDKNHSWVTRAFPLLFHLDEEKTFVMVVVYLSFSLVCLFACLGEGR